MDYLSMFGALCNTETGAIAYCLRLNDSRRPRRLRLWIWLCSMVGLVFPGTYEVDTGVGGL